MKTGDILVYAWGYDQTNADFFQVVRTTKKSAWIRPIAGSETPTGGPCSMTGRAKPILNRFTGPPKVKRIKERYWNDGPFLDMAHGIARLYEHPIPVSHYA